MYCYILYAIIVLILIGNVFLIKMKCIFFMMMEKSVYFNFFGTSKLVLSSKTI